ncbi:MAG: cold-shock protein [Pseudomonadota bacterium]|nr:cold-shock protein [Pseudomonadota bacterium]
MESLPQAGITRSGVTATVKWFNPAKGFGFVAPSDGTADAFLHVSVLHEAGLRTLRQGATINCDISDGPKGPQVANIKDVDNSTVNEEKIEGNVSELNCEIKFFAAEKGYGFGVPEEGGSDIFIGISALQRSNLDRLEPGQKVKLKVQDGEKGPMAIEIEILSDKNSS